MKKKILKFINTEKPDMVKPDMDLPRLETPAQINIEDVYKRQVKMNGAYAPPLTAPPAFADRQSRGDSKECCRPALLSERGNFHDRR